MPSLSPIDPNFRQGQQVVIQAIKQLKQDALVVPDAAVAQAAYDGLIDLLQDDSKGFITAVGRKAARQQVDFADFNIEMIQNNANLRLNPVHSLVSTLKTWAYPLLETSDMNAFKQLVKLAYRIRS